MWRYTYIIFNIKFNIQYKNYIADKRNRQQQHCKQLIYIYKGSAKAKAFIAFIRLFNCDIKTRQVNNGSLVKIQSVLCEDTLSRHTNNEFTLKEK